MIEGDTLIIGGGSAGCVLASRLSADPSRQVILFEAGPEEGGGLRRVLSGKLQMTGDPRFDWRFLTEPDPNLANRRLYWPRGKVLGGSSTINGLIATRGHRDDYDAWEALGCAGWSWNGVLPYFLRLEDCEAGASEIHHVGGPLPLSAPRGRHFLCDKLVMAARETLGIAENPDFNGATQEGAGYYAMNVSRDPIPMRVSAASAYLKTARSRTNLRVITDAHVHRILFEGRRATGVEYQRGGIRATATARRQVILSAGSIGSPQLLQLSGIGDSDHLRSLGIKVVMPLPAVGENLQDHLQIRSRFRFRAHTIGEKAQNVWRKMMLALSGIALQTGPNYGATNFGMFVRSNPDLTQPDLQFHIHPAGGSFAEPDCFSLLLISGWQLRPQSRGRIILRTADALAAPAIFTNHFASQLDLSSAVAILRIARRLADSSVLRPYGIVPLQPGPNIQSDAELLDFARKSGETTFHPVGTCRMGGDASAVVDPRLRVRGLQGLYVADASIMPTLISGNTHLPCVMIGEKASDIIIEDERTGKHMEVVLASSTSQGIRRSLTPDNF